MHLRHAVVEADARHAHARAAIDVAEGLKLAHLFGEGVVVGGDRPTLAQAGHVLVALKAVTGRQAAAADGLPLILRAHGVGGVVDHRHAGLRGDGVEGVDVAGQAGEVDGDDGLRARGDQSG